MGETGDKMGEKTSTRKEILHLLKRKGPMSVGEMAKILGISEMAVRRHLNTLERDNLLEATLVRQAMGRPINLYGLSEEADKYFPKNYCDFTLDLLQDIEALAGRETIDRLFARREERLKDQYLQRMRGKSLALRVETLAKIQNEKGYMVEWEMDEKTGNYIFKEYNCPISQVAREYNQACRCELSLFRKVLDTRVEQKQCMAKGGEHCVYVIHAAQA
ncbi:transcriptional regulator [Bacillaceae bacterium]